MAAPTLLVHPDGMHQDTLARSTTRSLIQRIAIGTMGLARPFAGRRLVPLYALIAHRGRTSGTLRITPIVARRTASGFVIPMPFGPGTQWARNVLAAGGATITWKGRDWPVAAPRMLGFDEAAPAFGAFKRVAHRIGIVDYLAVDDAPAVPPA